MEKNSIWKWLILIAMLSWSMMMIYPPFDMFNDDGKLVREGKLRLGLDLRGGTSYVLEVDDSEMDEDGKLDAQDRAVEVIRKRIDSLGLSEPIIYPEPDGNRIVVQLPGLKEEHRASAIKLIQSAAFLEFRIVHEDNRQLVAGLMEGNLAPPGYRIVTVDEPNFSGQMQPRKYYKRDTSLDPEGLSEADIQAKVRKFKFAPGHDLMMMKEEKQGQALYSPFYVSRRREMTGENLKTARVDYRQMGQPVVRLKFNSKGADRFARVTQDYAPGRAKNRSSDVGRALAVVLDGSLYSAPSINQPIYGGNAEISGQFTLQEAKKLAIVLRSGALPAPVKVIDQRHVSPTLGEDSIDSGGRAAMYGAVAIVVLMLFYYMLAGVIANLALMLDLLLLPLGMMIASGFLGLFTGDGSQGTTAGLPTLTLPGLAGIILTIGMAVDANVLIFERIREEQQTGKRFKAAISAGYSKAFSTIMDANVTTLLTAVILFWQGSGPIKGFAVTLSAGILISMYVALVVTRMFFNVVARKTNIEKVRMLTLVKETKINFVGMRAVAAVFSVVLIIAVSTLFVMRGKENFGVDFTGGTSISFQFDKKVSTEEVRDLLSGAGIGESFLQYQRELAPDATGKTKEYLEVKVGFEEGEAAKDIITSSLGPQDENQGYHVVQEDSVGPQIGKELRRQAVMAMVFALIGIVLYVTIRFEFGFAIGAIAALAHDIVITVGIYCLFGRQLSLPIIAALLTIVGYSVNDTIVVFDRIREDRQLNKDKSYPQVANLGINRTLSRTLLTSLTTLLTVVMLLVFGGGAINDFALALLIGILVGTYSSVFVATPVMLLWHRNDKKAA